MIHILGQCKEEDCFKSASYGFAGVGDADVTVCLQAATLLFPACLQAAALEVCVRCCASRLEQGRQGIVVLLPKSSLGGGVQERAVSSAASTSRTA